MSFHPNFDTKSPPVREVGKLMAPRVLGLAAAQMNFFVTQYFASKVSSDAISNLNYAWLIAGLPLAIFGMTISTAVFPTLAEQVAEGDRDALNRTISRALRTIMFFTIPASIGLVILREPLTITLLEHGKFTSADTAVTASALGWYCLGIIPQAGIEIHSRGFYALGNTRTPVFLAVGAVIMNLLLSAALWSRFEHEGLAFSVAAASWFEWALLYFLYHNQTGADVEEDLHALALFSLCGALMALLLALAHFGLDANGHLHALVLVVAGGVAGASLYHGFAAWFDVPNFADHVGQAKRIVARFRPGRA
jgi:putative peptidoglycan lipid II flippase